MMPQNYVCQKCGGRVSIAIKGKISCINCGIEMQPVLLYSTIIWPSLKEIAKKEFGYKEALLHKTDQVIKYLETQDLPKIEQRRITLDIPEITPSSIYELGEKLASLEKDLHEQLKTILCLKQIREEIREREISMAVCAKYATSSESPAEQYKIAIHYLTKKLDVEKDEVLKEMIQKLKEEKHQYETKWRYRGSSTKV